MISTRQQQLLQLIIENHVDSAQPVGSKFLVGSTDLGVSEATVRNEMRDLEEAGYLTHPHTSAGRIPTEAGYRFYVETMMKPKAVGKKHKQELESLLESYDDEKSKKKISAKYIAEYVEGAAIIAFSQNSVYYTGIANLFSQPEFADVNHTVNISKMFDHCEEHMEELFESITKSEPQVLIGDKNPLGNVCGLVGMKKQDSLFVILGPMRMDYGRSIGALKYISDLI